jgi:DNA-binding NarL/FixJ family response regulator
MLGFGRPGDFTSKDMDFLRLVDRPVVSLYRHARTLAAWRSRLDLPDHDIPGLCGQVGLTARETEVLYLLSTGLPAKSIARRMAVSPRTVHRHLSSIYAKFGTHDRLTTVVRAQRLGLLPQSG